MSVKSIIILFIVGLAGESMSFAQAETEEMTRITKAYSSLQSYRLEAVFSLYVGLNNTPIETYEFEMWKDGNSSYSKQKGSEMVANGEYRVVVNHEEQMIMIEPAPKRTSRKKEDALNQQVETLFNNYETAEEIEGLAAGQKGMQIIYKEGGQYRSAKLYYNPSTCFMEQIDLAYAEKIEVKKGEWKLPTMVLQYKNIKLKPHFSKKDFSEAQFIAVSKKEVKPSAALSSYQLLSHLN